MATRLIIDGNAVYEIDEDCLECRKQKKTFGAPRGSGRYTKPERTEDSAGEGLGASKDDP